MKALFLLTLACLVACANRQKVISGGFGEFVVPAHGEGMTIGLKSGDSISAKRVQEDGDSLFLLVEDNSIVSVAIEDIESIRVIERKPGTAGVLGESGGKGKGPAIQDGDYTKGNLDAYRKAQLYLFGISILTLIMYLMYKGALESATKG
jgi:hypothetical protein